ncbi:MAG: sugar transferase [Paracoccaceae bacterium]
MTESNTFESSNPAQRAKWRADASVALAPDDLQPWSAPQSLRRGWVNAALKRAFDLCFCLLALPFLGTLLALVWLTYRVTGSGPLFFRQSRYGYQRRPFDILKIRTMRVSEAGHAFQQAVPGDTRVTPLGRFLRASSLDELPQLINVLRGDMSIVGPRPHPTQMDDDHAHRIDGYDRRFLVKPGITGLAQVRGHRGPTASVAVLRLRIESDLEYVNRTSVWLDLHIVLRTIGAVVRPQNAH